MGPGLVHPRLPRLFFRLFIFLSIAVHVKQSEASEVGATVQRFLLAISLCGAPVDALQVCVTQLSRVPALHETLMAALWEGILQTVTVCLVEFIKRYIN